MNAPVTVIIPCYNQGNFLGDALSGLEQCDQSLFDVIIVDDGSTDAETIRILDALPAEKYTLIRQKNKGLSGARNTGIRHATGKYVLLLDADNKIRPPFIVRGIAEMNRDETVAVVYGNGEYFGDMQGIRRQGPFNLQKQMLVNHIDACAMVRRAVFEKVGYFDEAMKQGWEDWEMWLRIGFAGYSFAYVDEVFFDYRIRKGQMSQDVYALKKRTNDIEDYVYAKYPDKMGISHVVDFMVDRFKRNPAGFLMKLLLRAYRPKKYESLLQQHKIRNGL